MYYFGRKVETAVAEAGQSTGKGDSDKKQRQRAQRTYERMLGLKPQFADPLARGR